MNNISFTQCPWDCLVLTWWASKQGVRPPGQLLYSPCLTSTVVDPAGLQPGHHRTLNLYDQNFPLFLSLTYHIQLTTHLSFEKRKISTSQSHPDNFGQSADYRSEHPKAFNLRTRPETRLASMLNEWSQMRTDKQTEEK